MNRGEILSETFPVLEGTLLRKVLGTTCDIQMRWKEIVFFSALEKARNTVPHVMSAHSSCYFT